MTNNHWTDDAELLERYILHRLEEAEREELESHLRICSRCKDAVDDERLLIAGIRHTARAEMKARLKQRLAATPAPELPWMQLATAAAIVVILIGIGIYNDWFRWYGENQLTPEFRKEEPSSVKSEEPRLPPPREAEERIREKASTAEESARPLLKEQRKPVPDKSSQTETSVSVEGMREDEPAQDIAIERDENEEDKLKKSGWSTWVDGIILPHPEEQLMTQPEAPASEKRALSQPLKGKARKAAPTESQKIVVQQGARSQVFILSQRSATSQLKALQKPQTIPSFIEATEEGLKITLYVDTPYKNEDLRGATIEPIRQDSIIIMVGNQRIGYRIPGAWYEAVPAK